MLVQRLNDWITAIRNRLQAIIPPGSLSERFARGAFWSLTSMAISQGLAMLASIVGARLLGVEQFGAFGMVASTVSTFGAFAGLGLGLTATKSIAEHRVSDPQRAGRILSLTMRVAILGGGLASIVLIAMAPWLAENTLNRPELAGPLRLSAGMLFLTTLTGVQTGALAGFEAFRETATINLVQGLVNLPAMILGVALFGVSGAVGAKIVVLASAWIAGDRALRRARAANAITKDLGPVGDEISLLWRFSLPALLGGIMIGPVLWVGNTILVNTSDGYTQLGLVNTGRQWQAVLLMLPRVVANVALPAITSISSQNEAPATDSCTPSETERSIELAHGLNQLVLWPLAALLMFGAPLIMRAYGEDFGQGRAVFTLLIGGMAIGYVANTVGTLITSLGMMWFGVAQNLSWSIVLLVVVHWGVESWGGLAISAGTALGYLLLANWSTLYMQRLGRLPEGMARRVVIGAVLMATMTALALVVPSTTSVILAIPVALASAAIALWGLTAPGTRTTLLARAQSTFDAWRSRDTIPS